MKKFMKAPQGRHVIARRNAPGQEATRDKQPCQGVIDDDALAGLALMIT